jgi:hypothetical protein
LLAHGLWFSPVTPVSSTTKSGRHDIAEILLKVALQHQNSNHITYKHHKISADIKQTPSASLVLICFRSIRYVLG